MKKIYTKWTENKLNGNKIDQIWTENRPTSSIAKPSKIYPNCDFWFENVPFGNPGQDLASDTQ
jgi:hypothetical protein